MIASTLAFTVMSAAVKVLATSLPGPTIVLARNAIGLATLLAWFGADSLDLRGMATHALGGHLVRGLGGLAAMMCFFHALAHLPLADAVLLNSSTPLFMPFVERAWLAEPFPRHLAGPVLMGFAGVALVLKPGSTVFQPVALVGLAAAVFASIAQVSIRGLTRTEPARRIVFWFGVIATLGSLPPMAGHWSLPPRATWPLLLLLGTSATAGQLLLSKAYAHSPAGRVGPFMYTSVVAAAGLDWTLWGRPPDGLTMAGALLVALASVLALRLSRPPRVAPE